MKIYKYITKIKIIFKNSFYHFNKLAIVNTTSLWPFSSNLTT